MAVNQIPITYFVSASTVLPGATLEPLKLSTILLLTDEQPIEAQAQDYTISRTLSNVVNTYGSNSKVAKVATAIFSQSPNILANDGYVIVAPMLASVLPDPIPATAGILSTPDLSANVANFSAVTDGVLNLTIDGVNKEVTGLDFSSVETLQGVASVIQNAYDNVTVSVVGNVINITSNTTGTTSNVTIEAMTGDIGTDLYGATFLDGANCVSSAGNDEIVVPAAPETYSEAITRLAGQLYFNGVICVKPVSNPEIIAASATVQAMQDRIMFVASNLVTDIYPGGLLYQLQENFYTKGLLYTQGDLLEAQSFAGAYASRGFAVNYNGSNTTLTMNLKDLAGVQADTNITETILEQCSQIGVDCFPSVAGLAKVVSNKNRFYFDQVQNQIWFVSSIQIAVFNTLAGTGTKISQTEQGMAQIEAPIYAVCRQAIANGMGAPGEWQSPDTFGNLIDFKRNIRETGFFIYHLPVALQLQSEREQRKAPLVQVALKEAGAVHSASILVYINP